VAAALRLACQDTILSDIEPARLTYYLRRETIISSDQPTGMANWRNDLFSAMHLNANRASACYGLSPAQVVEVGLGRRFSYDGGGLANFAYASVSPELMKLIETGKTRKLTAWETGFVTSLRTRRYPLTNKQMTILRRIASGAPNYAAVAQAAICAPSSRPGSSVLESSCPEVRGLSRQGYPCDTDVPHAAQAAVNLRGLRHGRHQGERR